MTVQQERPTTTAPPVVLPVQRRGDHDAVAIPPRVDRRPGAWVTAEDRRACRWMMVAMLALGLYAALMVWLSARVW